MTARVFPAILSSFPFFVLHFFYLSPKLGQFWGDLLDVKIVSNVTVALVLLFFLMQLNRYISKTVFEKRIFADGLYLPTTDYLLHLDAHFSPEYTRGVHEKIKRDFNIEIPPAHEEARDDKRSRKIIAEAISHIRGKVRDGRLVGQHNAEYGFVRNLAGGAVIALVMALIDSVIFSLLLPNAIAIWVSVILAAVYIVIVVFAKKMIVSFGQDYGRILIQEYMLA